MQSIAKLVLTNVIGDLCVVQFVFFRFYSNKSLYDNVKRDIFFIQKFYFVKNEFSVIDIGINIGCVYGNECLILNYIHKPKLKEPYRQNESKAISVWLVHLK